MWESLLKLFRVPDLKRRVLFTLSMLVVFRIGAHIPVPGIDPRALAGVFSQGGILGFLDMFAGGALSNFSILALGYCSLYQCFYYHPAPDCGYP